MIPNKCLVLIPYIVEVRCGVLLNKHNNLGTIYMLSATQKEISWWKSDIMIIFCFIWFRKWGPFFFWLCYFPWASRPSTLRKNQNNCPRSYKKGENEESLKCSELEGVQNKTYRARNKGQSAVNDHQILRFDCQKSLICDQGDQPLFCNKSCTQVNSDRWWTVYKML